MLLLQPQVAILEQLVKWVQLDLLDLMEQLVLQDSQEEMELQVEQAFLVDQEQPDHLGQLVLQD